MLELRDLAPAELRAEMDKTNQYSKSSDVQEFEEAIGTLLPWHQLSVATLLGQITKASFGDELRRTREASMAAAKVYYRDDFPTSNEIARLWLDILQRLDTGDATTLAHFLEWKDALKRPLFTPTLTALARALGHKQATKQAALGFALEAFKRRREQIGKLHRSCSRDSHRQ